jgi:cellulose synthase/poly-beta-1,6-N-acetylglucosamine synthase-like glycosyltransferase
MPSEQGLVSIVVPVHNKEKARICAEHVRKQTYPNIELILVDFKGFPAEKRNYGYSKSKGEYVLFLDEDSYLSPSAISASVDEFKQGFDVVGIPAVKAEPKGYLAKCISVTRLGGAELKFFRRSVLQDVGLFRPEYALSDDLDLFVRIFRKGYRLGMVDPEEGYMIHDETNQLGSVLRKILFARKPYKNLQEEYGQTLDALTQKPTERKRIVKILLEEPILIPGVSLVMFVSFLIRRVP